MNRNNNILIISILSLLLSVTIISVTFGAGSQSIQPEVGKDLKYYNKGVERLMEKKFASAEKLFRKALEADPDFAEAHNNLAYVLRKQGSDNFDEALIHYNQAVSLKSRSARALHVPGSSSRSDGQQRTGVERP